MAQSYGGRGREERPRDSIVGARRAAESPRIRVDEEGGGTRTLVVDETFASFYRPGEIATHCVWDAIAAPILWLPPKRRRRILVLGLGGGSVARIARALAPARRDRRASNSSPRSSASPGATSTSTRSGVRRSRSRTRGPGSRPSRRSPTRYDAILEDVFVGAGDDVHKPAWIPDPMHVAGLRDARAGGRVRQQHPRRARAGRAVDARSGSRGSSRSRRRTTTTGCWRRAGPGSRGRRSASGSPRPRSWRRVSTSSPSGRGGRAPSPSQERQ